MQLPTEELRAQLASLYSLESNKDPTVICKFFCPWNNWTWFATEGAQEDDDFRFFGYVVALEGEWGYFVLAELEIVRCHGGVMIERNLYFRQGPSSEVIARLRRQRGQ